MAQVTRGFRRLATWRSEPEVLRFPAPLPVRRDPAQHPLLPGAACPPGGREPEGYFLDAW